VYGMFHAVWLFRAGIWLFNCCLATVALHASVDPLVAKYRTATCIPFSSQAARPHSREWRTTLSLRDGSQVTISGAQMPGGRIDVFYPATGGKFVAADAGDYVYPSDVRIDAQNDLLYVKADGLAGGIWERTFLFEYDLRQHRLVTRRRVKDGKLPEVCPEVGQHR